ncbi:NAD(P)/FAD-dependent oxidoreductase [Tepidiforma sp.]|uniref:dihydrolipoyl dehydrogenase family protein n=1 Tax=Tepidiforma sp. TaxID=2682230 RepID=UPI002ADE31C2|nr:NAD(P)/FAD-dependent oxidoreductase [Tepidiforma sp.]
MSRTEQEFDLVVIGNGAAGDNIARTLGREGLRVALVEAAHLGGECLNDGCVPSKALIEVAREARWRPIGWDEALARVHAVQLLVRGNDPSGGFDRDGVALFWGEARFEAPNRVTVNGSVLVAKDVVVATGTEPGLPPIPGLAEARPLTNRTIFRLAQLPRRLAVIGGGPIGLELGQALHRLGARVTLFEALERIAATEEPEVSLELQRLFEREGIRVVAGTRIDRVERQASGEVTLSTPDGTFVVDDVLVAAGRKPVIPAGLEGLGLQRDGRGFIAIEPCGRTSVPGVWAAGDVTGKFQFTHYAAYQAHHIAKHIAQDVCEPVPEAIVPWAIFTDPEVGHVGLTEAQARERGLPVRTGLLEARELDWFRTSGQVEGFAKVVVDAETGALLGAHFLCARGSTLAGEAALAVQHGLTARQVASTIHPYPTAGELFRWACAKAV